MKKGSAVRWLLLAALPLSLVTAACDRHPTDLGSHTLGRIEIRDLDQPGEPLVATWEQGTGWTGELPAISLGTSPPRVTLGARIFNASGVERPLAAGGEYTVRWQLASGAPAGIVATSDSPGPRFHGDRVHVYGLQPGTTRIQFVLRHFDHDDGASPPIEITVTE